VLKDAKRERKEKKGGREGGTKEKNILGAK
jgi:hypothetical protein